MKAPACNWVKKRLPDICYSTHIAVGAYNEGTKPGSHIKDRYYYGEHPYSGSYIYLGYWGTGRSSY